MKNQRNFKRQYNIETWIFPLYPSGLLLFFTIPFPYYLRRRDGPVRRGRVLRGGENSQILLLYSSLTIESICAFPQCALHNLMPAAEDCQGARLQTDGNTVTAEFLFWAPFLLCFLSTPFHAVTSPISKKEECAKAGEIAIFCYGSTHTNAGIWSH